MKALSLLPGCVGDEDLVHGVPLALLHGGRVVEVLVPHHVGVVRHHPDLVHDPVLGLQGQILDRDDKVLLLIGLHCGAQKEQEQVLHLGEGPRGRRNEGELPGAGEGQHQHLVQRLGVKLLDGRHDQTEVLGPGAGVTGLRVKLEVEARLEAGQGLSEEDALTEAEPTDLPGEVRDQGADPPDQGRGQEGRDLLV